jgi:hypothetical protein
VADDLRGKVDREALVDQVGDKHPSKVMRGERRRLPVDVTQPHRGGGLAEILANGAATHAPRAAALAVLEQVGHRRGVHELVFVAFDGQRDSAAAIGEAGDDAGEHGGEFGAGRQDAFLVALAGRDLQQRQNFAVGFAELPDAEVGELEQLLDADTGMPQGFDGRPRPEPLDLLPGRVDPFGLLRCSEADGVRAGSTSQGHAGVVLVVQGERLADLGGPGAFE